MKYTQHPLSAAFPAMPEADFDALCRDIAEHGQREPAIAIGTEILDGWHRTRACMQAGIKPWVVDFDGDDPVAFVKSKNLHRRHLEPSQRALAVAECSKWAAVGRPVIPPGGRNYEPPTTSAEMAREAQVGVRSIERAKVIAERAPEEIKAAVRDGSMSLRTAEATLQEPRQVIPPSGRNYSEPKPEREEMPASDAAGEGMDPLAELERAQKEIAELLALVQAAESDDLKAEAIKWRRAYEDAVRKQSEAMDATKRAENREAWAAKQLRRCGKAVGQEDPDKIAPAVEAFVRARGKVAA